MGSSNIEVYVHYIWHTEDRQGLLRGPLEQFVHHRIIEIAEDRNIEPIAVNSAWTHTHVLVRFNATSTLGDLAEDWKTTTSTEWVPRPNAPRELSWQTGYGAYSIRKNDVPGLVRYIGRQKRHHRDDSTLPDFERN